MSLLPKILIVEDENVLAENMKVFLGRSSPDVRVAPDAEQALKMLNSFVPDVVVMDLVLPGIDGLDAYSEIVRRSRRKIGCVMITGHPTDTLAESADARGIRHVLCKPFRLGDLQQLIDQSAGEYFDDPHLPFEGASASRATGAPQRRPPLCQRVLELMFVLMAVPIG